jgi:hypothetical protein
VINDATLIMETIFVKFNLLAMLVTDNKIFPVFLLSDQGTVCAIINTPYYAWINAPSQVERSIQK